jgi:hypothetical protein
VQVLAFLAIQEKGDADRLTGKNRDAVEWNFIFRLA